VEKINNKITDSEEGMFSLETVNCLGACALGPIMVVNDETHGHMSVDKVDEVLDALAEEEGE
jgi:NADH:ubiquinone oxidoreductase subunit E